MEVAQFCPPTNHFTTYLKGPLPIRVCFQYKPRQGAAGHAEYEGMLGQKQAWTFVGGKSWGQKAVAYTWETSKGKSR